MTTQMIVDIPEDPYREIVMELDLDSERGSYGTDSHELRLRSERFVRQAPWAELFIRPVLAQTNGDLSSYRFQDHFRKLFAYAIPSPHAVKAVADLGTIVEIGAGSGYWAGQLAAHGATVHAFDNATWGLDPRWYPVRRGGAVSAGRVEADALFLCWPPYGDNMATNALRAFRGETLAYVGEGYGGCTADDAFHDTLDRRWTLRREMGIPQFYGLHDRLFIYDRTT